MSFLLNSPSSYFDMLVGRTYIIGPNDPYSANTQLARHIRNRKSCRM